MSTDTTKNVSEETESKENTIKDENKIPEDLLKLIKIMDHAYFIDKMNLSVVDSPIMVCKGEDFVSTEIGKYRKRFNINGYEVYVRPDKDDTYKVYIYITSTEEVCIKISKSESVDKNTDKEYVSATWDPFDSKWYIVKPGREYIDKNYGSKIREKASLIDTKSNITIGDVISILIDENKKYLEELERESDKRYYDEDYEY